MRSPLSYLTFWFVPLLVRFNVYLGATKGLFDASVVLLLVTACTSSAIAMILGHLTDLGFCQGQRWAVFAGPVMLLGVSLFSAVSSVSSMVVMARMSQNVLVTLRNSFFSRAPQYQMFSIGRMSVKFVNKDTIALSGATESFMVLVRDSMLAVALLAVTFWHNWQLLAQLAAHADDCFLVAASPFVLRSISLRRRLIVKASQDNVGAMHSRVEESYGAQKLVQAACSCDSDGRHFAPVKAALARLARGKTTVTTIADTDWIVVLDNGVVHEQVTQAELLVRPSGLFHQLYKLQTAGRTHP